MIEQRLNILLENNGLYCRLTRKIVVGNGFINVHSVGSRNG